MFKATPNPPATPSPLDLTPDAVDRALAHYIFPQPSTSKPSRPGNVASPNLWEQTLVDACSILESAAAMAYDHADNLTGSNRKVAMGMVHLIELAQRRVDSALEEKLQGFQA